jgi:hypothetical protein
MPPSQLEEEASVNFGEDGDNGVYTFVDCEFDWNADSNLHVACSDLHRVMASLSPHSTGSPSVDKNKLINKLLYNCFFVINCISHGKEY